MIFVKRKMNWFMMCKEHASANAHKPETRVSSQILFVDERIRIPDPQAVKGCWSRLEAFLVVDVMRDMAVDARISSPDHIALRYDAVGASGAKRNIARHSAVVNVTEAESLVVNAHDRTRSWA